MMCVRKVCVIVAQRLVAVAVAVTVTVTVAVAVRNDWCARARPGQAFREPHSGAAAGAVLRG